MLQKAKIARLLLKNKKSPTLSNFGESEREANSSIVKTCFSVGLFTIPILSKMKGIIKCIQKF